MASVDKRPNGQWRARWREFPGGPQRTKQFGRKLDAERYLVKVQHDLQVGSYVDPTKARTTVRDYYEVWSARQPWREATRSAVTSTFSAHVLLALGDRQLGTLRRGDIETWAAGLKVAPRTAGLAVQHLGTMLQAAVGDGLLVANPARGAKRPRVDAAPVVPFTSDELERLRAACPPWFAVSVTLGALCGLRQGEATGLTLDRIDFLRRELTVDRQLVSSAGGDPEIGPPKTRSSYRKVPLADVAVEQLAAHLAAFPAPPDGLVLALDGKPLRRQRFGELWRAARKRAGLPDARFHDCRHTFASVLLSGGVSVAAAADYLGHTPAVLLETYAHLLPADHDRARSVVQAAFTAKAAEDRLRTVDLGSTL